MQTLLFLFKEIFEYEFEYEILIRARENFDKRGTENSIFAVAFYYVLPAAQLKRCPHNHGNIT